MLLSQCVMWKTRKLRVLECSALFVCLETMEKHSQSASLNAETTEHERFSTTATCRRWLTTCYATLRWLMMTTLWGDGGCHWRMMTHREGRRRRLRQPAAHAPNDAMSDDNGADSDIVTTRGRSINLIGRLIGAEMTFFKLIWWWWLWQWLMAVISPD